MERTRREWALWLASKGWPVFPLPEYSKEAAYYEDDGTKKGISFPNIMTTDPETINKWFDDRPGINYGVCGGETGFVIDLDIKWRHLIKDDEESPLVECNGMKQLDDLQVDEDPDDWITHDGFIVRSPSGGLHIYLKAPYAVGNASNGFALNVETHLLAIDVRGSNGSGYVVGPGSEREDGRCYEAVSQGDPRDAPEWVMGCVHKSWRANPDRVTEYLHKDEPHIIDRALTSLKSRAPATQGARGDEWTLSTLFVLRDLGVSEDKAIELLQQPLYPNGESWNDRCDPPWSDTELQGKVKNAYAYAKGDAGNKAETITTSKEIRERFADRQPTDLAEKEKEKELFRDDITFFGTDFMQRPTRVEFLTPYFFLANGVNCIYAGWSVGKSVMMYDLAMRLACDMDWHGQSLSQDYCVVYFCGENDLVLQQNMMGWMQVHGQKPAKDRLLVVKGMVELERVMDIEEWVSFVEKSFPGKKIAVFIDTWQRAIDSSDVGDAEMKIAFGNLEGIGTYFDGPCFAAMHPPKGATNDTIAGSARISNMAPAIIKLSGMHDQLRRMTVKKMKGEGEGMELLFEFQKIALDGEIDEHGKARTAIVPVVTGGVHQGEREHELGSSARNTLSEIIKQVIESDPDGDWNLKNMAEAIHTKYMDTNVGDKLVEAFGYNRTGAKPKVGWVKEKLQITHTKRANPAPEPVSDGMYVQWKDGKFILYDPS